MAGRRHTGLNVEGLEKFEIVEEPGKGHFMRSKEAIKPNEIILEEDPLVSAQFIWNKEYGYAACDYCMFPLETITENVQRLASDDTIEVPYSMLDPTLQVRDKFTICQYCDVRYCSEACRTEAFKKYHETVCEGLSSIGRLSSINTDTINTIKDVWKKNHYPPETGSITLLIRLLALYKQSRNKKEFLETMNKFQSIAEDGEHQIYHKMLGKNFIEQMEGLYAAYSCLVKDEEFALFNSPEAFKRFMALMATNSQGVATSVLSGWAKKMTDLEADEAEKEFLNKCVDEIYDKVNEFAGDFLDNEGVALYRLQSKINHSCCPNAQSSFPYLNDVISVKAIAPIQPGEEICVSYMSECQLARSRHTRQKFLKENYLFECHCPKCESQINDPDVSSEEEEDDDDEEMEVEQQGDDDFD